MLLNMSPLLALAFLAGSSLMLGQIQVQVQATVLTVLNSCSYTVWPAVQPNAGQPVIAGGGFELGAGSSRRLDLPPRWGGRLWARTGCATNAPGRFLCETGDCARGLECGGTGGIPPVTLAEITLADDRDWYDVSLVDGYNLQMRFSSSISACTTAGCDTDLNAICPPELGLRRQDVTLACKSACAAFEAAEFCCTGTYNSPATCKPTSYSGIFKSACPKAYSYAYDDASSLFTCPAGGDFTIQFCSTS